MIFDILEIYQEKAIFAPANYSSELCRFEFFTEKDASEETRLMIFDLKPFKDAADAENS